MCLHRSGKFNLTHLPSSSYECFKCLQSAPIKIKARFNELIKMTEYIFCILGQWVLLDAPGGEQNASFSYNLPMMMRNMRWLRCMVGENLSLLRE